MSARQSMLGLIAQAELVDLGVPVVAPEGLVYSSAPRSCFDSDGHSYVVKGPDTSAVVAEAIGYLLSDALGILVPQFALVRYPEGDRALHFGSRKVAGAMRDASIFVRKNKSAIAEIIVVDIWMANIDRNMGGLLAVEEDNETRIVSIDFEKSRAIADQHPLINLAQIEPGALWPRGELGRLMKGTPIPSAFEAKVAAVSDAVIARIVESVAESVPSYSWSDSTCVVLKRRRDNISALVKESWQ